MDLVALAQQCAPQVDADTMHRIVQVESGRNPYAIGVVAGRLSRQPRSHDEAVATARWLQANGYNFSVGLAQVNQSNFRRYELTLESAFSPCTNLRAGAAILKECFERARAGRSDQAALQAAFSCYYSGNFRTGFDHGYVTRVLAAGAGPVAPAAAMPPIRLVSDVPARTKRRSAVAIRDTGSIPTAAQPPMANEPASAVQPSALIF